MPEGGADLTGLGKRLREAGSEGGRLKRALLDDVDKAVEPLVKELPTTAFLAPYFPDRYAAVLAGDLDVTVRRSLAGEPKVTVRAQAREHARKIATFDEFGYINHPVFAQGPRRRPRSAARLQELARQHGIPASAIKGWTWKNGQTAGMRAGWFEDAIAKHRQEIVDGASAALAEIEAMIAGG